MKSDDFNLICDLYLQHGKIFKNFQPATIKSYRSTFSFFAKASNVETLSDLSPEIIEKFLLDGRKKELVGCDIPILFETFAGTL